MNSTVTYSGWFKIFKTSLVLSHSIFFLLKVLHKGASTVSVLGTDLQVWPNKNEKRELKNKEKKEKNPNSDKQQNPATIQQKKAQRNFSLKYST